MRFDRSKKEAILLYLLEKIDQGRGDVAHYVADSLGIHQSTVHRYLGELQDKGIIVKFQRGVYQLKSREWNYAVRRSEGALNEDTYAYDVFVRPHLESLPVNLQRIWNYVITEMVNNVIDHSGAEEADITVRQNYLNTTVVLSDNGIGIFEKIRNHFHYSSLEDSIVELFKGKLTTDSLNHSGEGIFFSSRMMDRFYVISSGKLFSCNQLDDPQVLDLASENRPGTTIIMTLSNFSTKDSQAIFNEYADVDGGFRRTQIPLKNAFPSPPVSRSQAKRLCNRLDKFAEVVLDFSYVDWMGQGFAHQLFSVFRREHPDILLIPVNMEEAVEEMYRHTVNT